MRSPSFVLAPGAIALLSLLAPASVGAVEPAALLALSSKSPAPPWPAGDELGMGHTCCRCSASTTSRT